MVCLFCGQRLKNGGEGLGKSECRERFGGGGMNLLGILLPMWVFYSLFPIIDARPEIAGFYISASGREEPISRIVTKMEAQSPGFYFCFVLFLPLFLCCMLLISWISSAGFPFPLSGL